jgi:hypothetical protein
MIEGQNVLVNFELFFLTSIRTGQLDWCADSCNAWTWESRRSYPLTVLGKCV